MVFQCQKDSFLKEFTSKVVSCEKATGFELVIDGKKSKIDGYEVVLEDTILFPEGGGQPSDQGFLNDAKVMHVVRRGDIAVHFVNKALNVGDNVKQEINWERRFDHMQQHSGQHLLSAILENNFNYQTVSWWLGEDVCHVELDTPKITNEEISKAENMINEFIREARPVSVVTFSEERAKEALDQAATRGLPADHKGDIRVIKIEGVDVNMCCGTHVTNLSQLQAIKILNSEKSKRKEKILLYFLVGNRVLNRFQQMFEREQQLVELLKGNASYHVDYVEKLQKNVKVFSKNLQNVLKEVACFEAKKLKECDPSPKYFNFHKKEAEPDFMNLFIRELGRTDIFLFLSTGDEKGSGNIVLYGEDKYIQDLGKTVSEIMEGKGAGKGNKFQAKVSKLENRNKAEKLIAEYFNKT